MRLRALRRIRPKSVRAKIICLLMVPVISLMALWAQATVSTAREISDRGRLDEAATTLLEPVGHFVAAVQYERSTTGRYAADPDAAHERHLRSAQRLTDQASRALRDGINEGTTDSGDFGSELPDRIERLLRSVDALPALRKRQDIGSYGGYTALVDAALAVDGALTRIRTVHAPPGASEARALHDLARAGELLAREDTLFGAAGAGGRMPRTAHEEFTGTVIARRELMRSALADLNPRDARAYRAVLSGDAYRALTAAEDAVRAAGPGRAPTTATATTATTWERPARTVLDGLHAAGADALTRPAAEHDPYSFDELGGAGVAVALGLFAVLLSLLISAGVGRSLVVELVGLRDEALDLARRELPSAMRRLHQGEEVDIDTLAPARTPGEDEVSQIGAALVAVERAALRSSARRAEVLARIADVYVGLARRSQVLLHRQLGLLDEMERRVESPEDLEDLFRIDHLTTRMRRHAESLIILSGSTPGRGWRQPVPLLDVVRSAVAEVEDFARVETGEVPDVRVPGSAVADVVHLVAELVENATSFSPPHTKVTVRADRVGSGVALEIEDRGLGMKQEALAEANRRIEDAARVDLLDSERLGLFVVNRLAHRQNIRVTLRASVYGGVCAIALLPEDLVTAPVPARRRAADTGLPRRRSAPAVPPHDPPPDAPTLILTPLTEAASGPIGGPTPDATPPADPAVLPRRVRQTHMAAPLREGPAEPRPAPVGAPPPRTPDQARATMSALRSGWQRGRATPPGDGSPPPTRRPSPTHRPSPPPSPSPSRGEDNR
ncbi:sensor histidine kinase [Streptomyces mesophilus]|uniref:sensor histidine kinase n=1 Tax=Streptomyces mesophilus TaxID=1775132 RepID=UPI00332FC237